MTALFRVMDIHSKHHLVHRYAGQQFIKSFPDGFGIAN